MKNTLELNEHDIKLAIEQYVERETGKEAGAIRLFTCSTDLGTKIFANVNVWDSKEDDDE